MGVTGSAPEMRWSRGDATMHDVLVSAKVMTERSAATARQRGARARRVSAAAVIVLGLPALAACGQPSPGQGPAGGGSADESGWFSPGPGGGLTPIVTPSEPTTKPQPLPTALAGVTLMATLRVEGAALVADYAVSNRSDRPVVAVDRIPKSLGSAKLDDGDLDPAHAWVLMAGERVRVTKQAFPIAPGVRFIADPVIGAHVLQSGASLSGTGKVPLPPTLDVPGPEFEAPRGPIVTGETQWEFCVQVAALEQPSEVVSVSEVARAPLLCSDPAPLPSS